MRFLSAHTRTLPPASAEWLESALADADEEAGIMAAELWGNPTDRQLERVYETLAEQVYDRHASYQTQTQPA